MESVGHGDKGIPAELKNRLILDQYRIESLLAEGGTSRLYLARQTYMDRYAVVKVLHEAAGDLGTDWRQRFRQEARVASRLQHPHIVTIFNYGELEDGHPVLAMEYIQGHNLRKALTAGPLSVPQTVRLGLQIASALAYAHERGVIHRDLKPDNVMLGKLSGQDHIKVLDFGLAHLKEATAPDLTHDLGRCLIGTPAYMSPEQCRGDQASERSDQYALALVLWEMISGRIAFGAHTNLASIQRNLYAPLPPLASVTSEPGAELLDPLLMRMAAKKQEDRFDNIRTVIRLLTDVDQRLHASKSDESLNRFAGGLAHDVNNQLTVVLSAAELALTDLHDPRAVEHELHSIQQAARRAAALTSHIVRVGRPQLPQPQRQDLNCTVRDLEPLLQTVAGDDITLRVELDSDACTVEADEDQVAHLLTNLTTNARDAMPGGGELTITTRAVTLDASVAEHYGSLSPGPHVQLTVADSGRGMDEAVRERAFEPFFTTKSAAQGAGLGLSMVYGIVKQCRGHILINSAEGRGTRITIYLPHADQPAVEAVEPCSPIPMARSAPRTVLAVEDEEGVLRLTARILRRAGFRVLEAADGHEAVELARQHPETIDLLLTDVAMPGLDGLATARALREMRPDLAVLYMSGYTGDVVDHHRLHSPDIELLQKPFSPAALLQRVQRLLDDR